MQILNWSMLTAAERELALRRPAARDRASIDPAVAALIAQVRRQGIAALQELTLRFDQATLTDFEASAAELAAARAQLGPTAVAAIERAIGNVRRFHAAQRVADLALEVEPGVHCERVARPLSAVGLYVPAGSAPLPSTAIMLAVPAELAGCPVRVVCTPPRSDGSADPAVLVAAQLAGATQIFKLGGVQAIAAMAYGVSPIPKVCKIFGPGNAYVTAAKQQVANDPAGAALDLPAGPSEVMIIADGSARPTWVAADLLAQAEHDGLAQALLLSTDPALTRAVLLALQQQLPQRSRKTILAESSRAIRLIDVADLSSAIAIAEHYAPEHLLLQTTAPRVLLASVTTAGSVFVGHYTPETMGDYCSGTNHVLPTYGYARSYSGLSLLDFQRRMTVQELSASGLKSLGPVAMTLAQLEGLDAHAAAVELRLSETPVSSQGATQ